MAVILFVCLWSYLCVSDLICVCDLICVWLWSYLCVCDLICVSDLICVFVISFACLWSNLWLCSCLCVCDLICVSVIWFVCLWSYLCVSLCTSQTHRSALTVTVVDNREVGNSAEATVAADIRWIQCYLNFVFLPSTTKGSPKYLTTLAFSKNILPFPLPPVCCPSRSSYMSSPTQPNVTRENFSRR